MTDTQGLLLCAKYAAAPNYFGYCGPSKSPELIDHLKENIADSEVLQILSEFETLYPYLQLIARVNRIREPLQRDVVEAYWIGNDLLHTIKARDTYDLLREKLFIEKLLEPRRLLKTRQKMFTLHFLPHHTFHVFNIFKRTGNAMGVHSLETMDSCRIGWGKVQDIVKATHKSRETLFVSAQSITLDNVSIKLTRQKIREIQNGYQGKQFIRNVHVGDWVSFHWGYLCDVLTASQVTCLSYYTRKAMEYYNSPLV